MDLQTTYKTIAPAVKEAGDKLKELFENKSIDSFSIKAKGEILTKADTISEEIIVKAIKKNFPAHDILSEEAKEKPEEGGFHNQWQWIVDPLDGTTNFAMRNPFFNVTAALAKEGEIVMGIVYAPIFREFYYAIKGEGAFLNDKKIKVNENRDMDKALHAFCYGGYGNAKEVAANYYKESLLKGYQTRQLGAAALELARVGAGILDSMVVAGANPWDVAAGALIVQEAGGVVTDFEGKNFTVDDKTGIIAASTKEMHSKIVEMLYTQD